MFGILNIDKPQGLTSRRVVDRVQRLVRPAKVGHAGTLDPLATGVLVVCVGPATRLMDIIQQSSKTYRATFLLGRSSDTEDVEGEVRELDDPPRPTRAALDAAVPKFLGQIQQRPPAFSALKVSGRRAYDLARKGQQVNLAPRNVRIDRLAVLDYEYPQLCLDIVCGSGTYIRSLGRDLALSLGTAAVMSALTRTAVGAFPLSDALSADEISNESIAGRLLPPLCAFAGVTPVTLDEDEVRRVRNGQSVESRETLPDSVPAVDDAGRLVAVLTRRDPDWLRPIRTFPPE